MSRNKYEIERAETVNSCMDTKKNLKARLKIEKMKMRDFIGLSRNMDMPWEARYTAIGQLCLQIRELKQQLKRTKNVKK